MSPRLMLSTRSSDSTTRPNRLAGTSTVTWMERKTRRCVLLTRYITTHSQCVFFPPRRACSRVDRVRRNSVEMTVTSVPSAAVRGQASPSLVFHRCCPAREASQQAFRSPKRKCLFQVACQVSGQHANDEGFDNLTNSENGKDCTTSQSHQIDDSGHDTSLHHQDNIEPRS